MRSLATTTLLLAALSGPLPAQSATTRSAPGLGGQPVQTAGLPNMPALPPMLDTSPKDSMLFVDRVAVGTAEADYPYSIGTVTPTEAFIPAALTGTGFNERVFYHVPSGYTAGGGDLPLVVAYHGFGSSAASVGNQSTIDEHCEARGWFYLSVTGLDDKLFGTPVSQGHVDVAIQWMLDQFDIDVDRIYMVGFSMGAGVVTNFAARHRDPGGIMIAALATVSGAFDWTTSWYVEPAIQPWMLNTYNFGASPAADPFVYQRSSTLHFDPASYPPYPGTHDPDLAMATNLTSTPLYTAWDSGDTLTHLPAQSQTLGSLVTSAGGQVETREVSNTLDPATGLPAPHSWAVLDVFDLFDFLDGKVVQRYPASFTLQTDSAGPAGWLELTQGAPGGFTWLEADATGSPIDLSGVLNADQIIVDLAALGVSTWPVRLRGSSVDVEGFRLGILSPSLPPGWFVDSGSKLLIFNQAWDPAAPYVTAPVPAMGSLDVRAWGAPWDGQLVVDPNPVGLGQSFTFEIAVPPGADAVWLVINLDETFFFAPNGHKLLVSPVSPGIILPLLVDPLGRVDWPLVVPPDPILAGLRLLVQGATMTSPLGVSGTTNPFSLLID